MHVKHKNVTARQLIRALKNLQSPNAFNPYAERCTVFDKSTAPAIRRGMLLNALEAAMVTGVDAIWVGRDLGYRGGRRTGIPMTDDAHLPEYTTRSGIILRSPTKGEPITERTATMIWSMLTQIDVPIFLWNVFPLHPHQADNPFSNRAHTAAERDCGLAVLQMLTDLLQPDRLVAIGNDAASSCRRVFAPDRIEQVRHPSYGGYKDFTQSIKKLYLL